MFNFLEKSGIYLGNNELSKKVLVCLYPILPSLTSTIYKKLFNNNIRLLSWPDIDEKLLINDQLQLPIQVNGKLVTTISTKKGDYLHSNV